MSALEYVIIGVASAGLIAVVVVGAIMLWRRQVRRSLIGLTGRREAMAAAYRGLQSVFASLAEADADELTAFALDPDSGHRRSLEDLHSRMRMQAEELAEMTLPKQLWVVADCLGTAAALLAVETGRVGEADSPEAVLAALGAIDVPAVTVALDAANEAIDGLLAEHGIEDPSVYGGGMYI